ncbi:MAG: ABC transporter permease [Candidatus Heimdallarchaeota archaeon]|nr:MAG: ABC transporter permease [Candidatus Heimdallarchaeota archaeon]
MLKLALRNVTRSKWRTFLLILGITLTVALETGIVVTIDTIYDDFIFDHRNHNYTDITVNPKNPYNWLNLTTIRDLTSEIKSISGVRHASEVYYIAADRLFKEAEFFSNVLIYGINHRSHPDLKSLNLTEGYREVIGKSILISDSIKNAVGGTFGRNFTMKPIPDLGFKGANLTIGGIYSDPTNFGNKDGFTFIFVDIETIRTLFEEEMINRALTCEIDISVNNLANIKKVSENIEDTIRDSGEYLVFVEKDISELQAIGIRTYSVAMNLVIIASLLVEFLFTTNFLTIAIRERQKEYGILQSVGISSKQLILTITYEILIYSILGIIAGIYVGVEFSNLLVGIVDQFYVSLEFQTIIINPPSIIAISISGIAVALIAGLYPIYLALNVPIIQNIHTRMRTGRIVEYVENWRYLVFAGIILTAIGFSFAFFVGPTQFLEFSLISSHFLVIILLFLGALLIEAGILIFLPKVGGKFLIMFNDVSRQLSMRNVAREFHKSLFTVMTATVALAFIIMVGVVSASVITSVPQYYQSQWGAIDLVVETSDTNPFPTNFTEELNMNPRIKSSAYIQETRTEIGEENGYVYGVDPQQYAFFGEPVFESIVENLTEGLDDHSDINVLVSDNLYRTLNVSLGEEVSVKVGTNNSVNVTIVAVVKGNAFLGSGRYIYLASIYYGQLFNSTTAKWFICDVFDDIKIYEAQTNITKSYPELKDVIGIQYYRNVIRNSLIFQATLFQVLFLESFILAGIAQFVSILISTLRMEREMGIMRSMGLSKRGVFGVFMAESFALGFSALIFGVADGLFGAALIIWYISFSIPVDLLANLQHIILWLVVSLLFSIASTIIPSYKSSQKEVVATIAARPIRTFKEKKTVKLELLTFIDKERVLVPEFISIFFKVLVVAYYIFILFLAFLIIRGIFLGGGISL